MESRVELFARIRRDARVEGLSVRALAARHKVHRRTVRQALESASPPPRKPREAVARRLEPFKPVIDAMLIEDTTAPRKQRHTARRILARLIEEHGAEELSYSTVRDYVRVRRARIDVEAGRRVEAFVPQEHAPGAEAEVDFGEVWVLLNGVKTKCHMFIFRLSNSGKAIHRIYPTQAQEAFLEGHIEAFQVLGRIQTKHIRYDNLTSAVTAVVFGQGRKRQENDRWVLFRSHYGFDPFYCQPGIGGAHEKGGVEGEVGWFRRNRLSPMPIAASLDELNDRIRAREALDDARRINDRIRTIGQDFALEQPFLAPLPAEAFDPGLVLTPRVDRSSIITVRMMKYSVPARLIGRKVRVSLRASEVVVFDGRTAVARHPRIVAKHGQSVQLDHYLEVLKTKPGALPGSTALARARESGAFTNAHEALDAMVMHDGRDRMRLHLTAEYVLIRALLEAATTALWILGPDDSDTRVTRALRLRHDELKHSMNLAKNFARYSNTLHGSEYIVQQEYVNGQIEDLRTMALDAELDPASVTKDLTPSVIAAESGVYVPDLGGPLTYWYWSTASSLAHGEPANMRALSDMKLIGVDHRNNPVGHVEPSETSIFLHLEAAHQLITKAHQLWNSRARRADNP